MSADSALVDAIRHGDYRTTRSLVLTTTPAELRADARRVRTLYRAVGAVAEGDVSPDDVWLGENLDHYDCATLTHMACIGVDRAARLSAVSHRVAADLPALFPNDLEHVVAVWSELYQRSPKNWDRIAHYSVIFAWVRRGLVAPPTADGAVNLWLSELASSARRYPPEQYAALYTVTLPRLFTAEVRPSLGAAALDSQVPPGDGRRIDELVLQLVRDGVWAAADVVAWVEHGLAVRDSLFQRRWLTALRDRLR